MASRACGYVINIIFAVLGLIIVAGGLWVYIEVVGLTNLRNRNHYLLDYNLYWPQVTPWLFILVGLLVIFVSCCGVFGAKKSNRQLVVIHVVFISIAIFGLLAATIVSLIFTTSSTTENFIKDTVWDVFVQSKRDIAVADAYGSIEKRLQCCGAESPRDYVSWKTNFPQSCCDTYYHGWYDPPVIDCDIVNKLPNERHGCSQVVTQYIRIAVFILSGFSILTAIFGFFVLSSSINLSKALRSKPRDVTARYESESKKVLL